MSTLYRPKPPGARKKREQRLAEQKRIEKLAHISAEEYAELDRMIAEAKRLKGTHTHVSMGRQLADVKIGGLGTARVYVFAWAVDGEVRGTVGWRPYGADEEIAAFQAVSAKYFSDGVQASSVTLIGPDGHEEKLRNG